MKRNLKIHIASLFLVAVGLVSNVKAQDVEVSAKLDTSEFLIGDQVGLELKVKQPVGEFVGIPFFEQSVNQELEILEESKNDTILLETGHYIIKKRLLVTAFDSGYYALPSIPFLYYSDTLRTGPIAFHVKTITVDTSQAIKDIKMPYSAPISFAEVYPWAGGTILLGLLIVLTIYIIRKLRRNEPIIRRVKPREPAHIIAFRELIKLKDDKLWQKGLIKDYYTGLTDILRLYLWNRYAIRTLERTSEEILDSLKISDFDDDEAFNTLKEIFYLSDLVKFAKLTPIADDNEKCMAGASDFVERTKLIIEEMPEGEGEEVNNESENKPKQEVVQK